MIKFPLNSKIEAQFLQGNIGSSTFVDVGSCTSDFNHPDYSNLDFQILAPLPFKIIEDNKDERIQKICSSTIAAYGNNRKPVGYIELGILYDKKGPKPSLS